MILETQRLIMREMTQSDYEPLCKMLKNEQVMYAYEHAFSDDEAHAWLDRQIARYTNDGYSLWAVILKSSGEMIGQCGLTKQYIGKASVAEIGYIFCAEYWHKGYAGEAAELCKKYAFDTLKLARVYSIIRDNNIPSQNVAKRVGMRALGIYNKTYYNMNMPHIVYAIDAQNIDEK